MLELSKCNIQQSVPANVASNVTYMPEGSAVVHVFDNGEAKATPSTGVAGEVFMGVSMTRATTPTDAPMVEVKSVPYVAPFTVSLTRTPTDPLLVGVVVVESGVLPRVVLTKAAAASATNFSLAGSVVTVDAAYADRQLKLVYRFALTHQEALLMFNYDSQATVDLVALPVIGLIQTGDIATDMYDPTVDWSSWSSANPVRLAANGKFTLGGAGTALNNALVTAVPSSNSSGFLVIRIQAN